MPTALLCDIVETQCKTVAMLKLAYSDIGAQYQFKGSIWDQFWSYRANISESLPRAQ